MKFVTGDRLKWKRMAIESIYEVVADADQNRMKIAYVRPDGILVTQMSVYTQERLQLQFKRLTKLERALC